MVRMHRFVAPLALVLIVAISTVPAATWMIDGTHSSVTFSVKHLMISKVRGEFTKTSGTIEWDGKDISTIKVDATIDATTIDTREPKRDEHLRSADFFDVAKHPTITFRSKSATAAGAGKFKLVGDLTMHGVTKEVALDVEGPTDPIQDPWGNAKVGATATGKVNRQDFGITWSKTMDGGGLVVGDEVAITLDLELAKKPDAPPAAAEKPAGK